MSTTYLHQKLILVQYVVRFITETDKLYYPSKYLSIHRIKY